MSDAPSTAPGEALANKSSALARAEEAIKEREAEIDQQTSEAVLDVLQWVDLTPEEAEAGRPPARWVEAYGADAARRRYNAAAAAHKPGSEAPAGLRFLGDVWKGIQARKAKQGESAGSSVAMVVQINPEKPPESIVVAAD